MSVKLHKITLFVFDTGEPAWEHGGLDQLAGDCYHNSGVIGETVEVQTAEFDREWSDDDPLNKTATTRAELEKMVEGKEVWKPFDK